MGLLTVMVPQHKPASGTVNENGSLSVPSRLYSNSF